MTKKEKAFLEKIPGIEYNYYINVWTIKNNRMARKKIEKIENYFSPQNRKRWLAYEYTDINNDVYYRIQKTWYLKHLKEKYEPGDLSVKSEKTAHEANEPRYKGMLPGLVNNQIAGLAGKAAHVEKQTIKPDIDRHIDKSGGLILKKYHYNDKPCFTAYAEKNGMAIGYTVLYMPRMNVSKDQYAQFIKILKSPAPVPPEDNEARYKRHELSDCLKMLL